MNLTTPVYSTIEAFPSSTQTPLSPVNNKTKSRITDIRSDVTAGIEFLKKGAAASVILTARSVEAIAEVVLPLIILGAGAIVSTKAVEAVLGVNTMIAFDLVGALGMVGKKEVKTLIDFLTKPIMSSIKSTREKIEEAAGTEAKSMVNEVQANVKAIAIKALTIEEGKSPTLSKLGLRAAVTCLGTTATIIILLKVMKTYLSLIGGTWPGLSDFNPTIEGSAKCGAVVGILMAAVDTAEQLRGVKVKKEG